MTIETPHRGVPAGGRRAALRRFGTQRPVAAGLLLATVAGVAGVSLGEALGWPFLAAPLARGLSAALERRVHFDAPAESAGQAVARKTFRVRFLGGVSLQSAHVEIAAPAWSEAPHLLRARDVELDLRYADLWRSWRAADDEPVPPLRIQRLQAAWLDARLERGADGRASWQFAPAASPTAPAPMPSFGTLQVGAGSVQLRDEPLALALQIELALVDAAKAATAPSASASAASSPQAGAASGSVLQARAEGRYRKLPVQAELTASGPMPWAADNEQAAALPLRLDASVGRARLTFEGRAQDALRLRGLSGRFTLSGPSLAAVGDPLGVTLPTTAPFRSAGVVVQQPGVWRVKVDSARLGGSRLDGAFSYDTRGRVPLLAGRLGGARLLLADLGPVVGTTVVADAGAAALAAPTKGPGKVLPDRPFDLASLRVMDANVLIDIASVDLNTRYLQPLQPLRGHLVLNAGVLTLSRLDARTAQGDLRGTLRLDGQGAQALWQADLRWRGVRLERWLQLARADGQPPWVSGRLNGSAVLSGHGRSTAEILASLKGRARTELRGGTVSHLAIEAAGLDLAQSLGLVLKGDDALPVHCAVADLSVAGGVFSPRVMVIDTSDSTVWVDGSLSLASETLDLRAVVSPKDFSPLALRTPLRLQGSFSDPDVTLEKGPMGMRLGAAFLLALANPLAALIPLIDTGSADDADRDGEGCQSLIRRRSARDAAPAPR